MPPLGDGQVRARTRPIAPKSAGATRRAADWLHEARERERAGCIPEAIECYESAIAEAEPNGEPAVLAEALRRLGVLRHHRGQSEQARELCRRSHDVARGIGSDLLAAEALNSLGCVDMFTGSLADAHQSFLQALGLGGSSRELHARVEQNLGILANMQGELDEAMARYQRSLEAYRDCGDKHGCALAYHNLGMVSADRGRFTAADTYFRESLGLAALVGDVHLRALSLVEQAEVDVDCQRFENARENAESALALFDQLGVRGPVGKVDAYRVIGMIYRETGRPAIAESRLRCAMELAVTAGSVLGEAEAARELAVLYQMMGRNQEALRLLNAAHRLFKRLDARVD